MNDSLASSGFRPIDAVITASDQLREALADYDKHDDAAQCLARCMRNLDAACKGDRHAEDGIKTALHIFQREMRRTIVDGAIEACSNATHGHTGSDLTSARS